jgi:rare lipoprotein A
MMAGCTHARTRLATCALKMAAGAIGLALLAAGPALAQAPIVYKASASTSRLPALDNRADPMALTVAPHAPIPSFGPAPMASRGLGEPLPLKTAVPMPSQQPQARSAAMAVPYAGPPYQVAGRWYVPAHEPNYNEVGIASWYGPTFHGKASASGETFDENAMTAAHPTLPIPSLVRVTNLENGRTVIVRINDRGPFVDDRIIDLSKAAGAALDMHAKGTAKVRVQYVGPAPADGASAAATPAPALIVARLPPVAQPIVPAPAVAAPVAAMPAPSGAGRFFVQAGSFSDLGNAHAVRQRLSQYGPVTIETAQVNGDEFYRVMVGPWLDRDAAETARQNLARRGQQGLVVARAR